MLIIRFQDRSDERNDAIVRLYKEGWKQEALAQMWGITNQQVSNIVGAEKRMERISNRVGKTQKLSPKHEQIIRRAPKNLNCGAW